jgi:hypothetical protein
MPHIPMSTRCGRDNMQISLIPSLTRNWEHQLRAHPTRARRFVDHLTGDRAGTTVSMIPAMPGRAPRGTPVKEGSTPNRLGAKLNDVFKYRLGHFFSKHLHRN